MLLEPRLQTIVKGILTVVRGFKPMGVGVDVYTPEFICFFQDILKQLVPAEMKENLNELMVPR